MSYLYPIRLQASLHETIWGGRRLAHDAWKVFPSSAVAIGEAWETEVSTVIQNGPYAGQSLGSLVEVLDDLLLGAQAITIFGQRFPLLAKFIDAHAQLSVQVHPNDAYAAEHEDGKLGKTEFWYILAAEPQATIVHGFKSTTNRTEVQQAIQNTTLDQLLHVEPVQAGDVIFVPAGTVHAIGSNVLLYELQEYSDVTYRMYDYGRLTATGQPRELHIERSLDVAQYNVSPGIKTTPVTLTDSADYTDRCLVACRYFLTRELTFKQPASVYGSTRGSCIILTSLGAQAQIAYGDALERCEQLARGETMVLPAALGDYRIAGEGALLCSYVPTQTDEAWHLWQQANPESASL